LFRSLAQDHRPSGRVRMHPARERRRRGFVPAGFSGNAGGLCQLAVRATVARVQRSETRDSVECGFAAPGVTLRFTRATHRSIIARSVGPPASHRVPRLLPVAPTDSVAAPTFVPAAADIRRPVGLAPAGSVLRWPATRSGTGSI